jgi:hypothetical protein
VPIVPSPWPSERTTRTGTPREDIRITGNVVCEAYCTDQHDETTETCIYYVDLRDLSSGRYRCLDLWGLIRGMVPVDDRLGKDEIPSTAKAVGNRVRGRE